MGYGTNAHAENLVPGESTNAHNQPRFTATYTATANGSTDAQPPPGASSGQQGPLGVEGWREVDVDIFLTGITGTSIQFFVDRQGTDGRWYNVASGAALTAASTGAAGNGGAVVAGGTSLSIGPGLSGTGGAAVGVGKGIRIRWVGVALTTATFTISVIGKS